MRRWGLLIAICAWLLAPGPGQAANSAHIVVDADSGQVIGATAADQAWYPASLAKLMTAYVFLDAVEAGRLSLGDTLKISKAAAQQAERNADLVAGQKIKAETALELAVVHSANDAAVVLAEAVAGTEDAFVLRMNEEAKKLGLTSTRYANASGLPDADARITARDAAVLARAVLKRFPQHAAIFSKRSVKYGTRMLGTSNGLLDRVGGATGMKTGFTCWSGYNVILTAEREGRTLIAVVLGGTTRENRDSQAARLINAAFLDPNAETETTLADLEPAAGKGPPPKILPEAQCNTLILSNAPAGKLPGWGVVFGSFPSVAEARAKIRNNLQLLDPAARRGRATVIPTTRRPVQLQTALLTGLNQQQVVAICNGLIERNVFCRGLPPNILNNPNATWR